MKSNQKILNVEAKAQYKVPFGTVSITAEARQLINECLDAKLVTRGKLVGEFER